MNPNQLTKEKHIMTFPSTMLSGTGDDPGGKAPGGGKPKKAKKTAKKKASKK
jgi:hypothetical protein